MTISLNRIHNFEVVQQTGSSDDRVSLSRIHNFEVVQQTGSSDDRVSLSRIHNFEVVQQTGSSDDRVSLSRIHNFAVVQKKPVFSIVGDVLKVSGGMEGTWPVTVRATDANGQHYDKVLNITIDRPRWQVWGSFSSSTDASAYTYSSAAIGQWPSASRLVVVVVTWAASTARTLSSATIDGVAATINVQANNPSGLRGAAIISAMVSTHTAGDIVVNFSGTVQDCCMAVASGDVTSATPVDTDSASSDSAATLTVTDLAVSNHGFVVTGLCKGNTATVTASGNGADAISNIATISIESTLQRADGGPTNETISTNDYTASWTGATTCVMVGASFA